MAMRQQLRTITAEIHQALHGAEPFARIAAHTMDRKGYAALLCFLFRYHAAMQAACAAGAVRLHAPELADAQQRRLTALRADLAVLGAAVPVLLCDVPGESDFAVGVLYTVLGSTLGGKVIYRQLDGLLPDDDGRRFFKGAPEDGAHWRLFCTQLEAAGLDEAQAEAGASFAFARFQSMLEEAAPV
jgi:heme oxygenase